MCQAGLTTHRATKHKKGPIKTSKIARLLTTVRRNPRVRCAQVFVKVASHKREREREGENAANGRTQIYKLGLKSRRWHARR